MTERGNSISERSGRVKGNAYENNRSKKQNAGADRPALEVWESSVRATHLFLSAGEIDSIKEYVPQALKGVPHLLIAEDDAGHPAAFMGIENGTLEMLFIAPEERGKGLGKRLLLHGIENYGVERLAVNEQNPQARGFYEHMGFQIYKRTDHDEQGNPYPLLYMSRT